jgi:hypothetical protein
MDTDGWFYSLVHGVCLREVFPGGFRGKAPGLRPEPSDPRLGSTIADSICCSLPQQQRLFTAQHVVLITAIFLFTA